MQLTEIGFVSGAGKKRKKIETVDLGETKLTSSFFTLLKFYSCPKKLLKVIADNTDYTSPLWKYFDADIVNVLYTCLRVCS